MLVVKLLHAVHRAAQGGPYVAPPGNAVIFNLQVSYTAPAGNAVILNIR
jgi:hypothetical protein